MKFKLNHSGLSTQRGLYLGLGFLLVYVKTEGHVGRITDKKHNTYVQTDLILRMTAFKMGTQV